mmetsp:Transcript_36906/g.83210  ORF Transcript_36906/g.83210 Transcript_36906/m.83210 type:complete len:268 (+) Transcript_36906:1411-2214(+)
MRVEDRQHVHVRGHLRGLGLGEGGQAVHQSYKDGLDVDPRLQLRAGRQELLQGPQVELVREDLDDDFHEVLLGDLILAAHYLLQDAREDLGLVHLSIDPLEVRQSHEVGPDEDAEVEPLPLPPLSVAHGPLMLHAHPEFVHLSEVVHQEVDAVAHVAPELRPNVGQLVSRTLQEVVPQEQPAHRMLDAPTHLHEVLENVPRRRLLGSDVNAANSDQEEQSRDDVPGVLDELVQLHHPPSSLPLLQEVLFQVSHLVCNHDVELVEVLG